ncbi:Tyrosyl-DNA phosphodiesterase 1, partial [Trichinella pseudospiralis]
LNFFIKVFKCKINTKLAMASLLCKRKHSDESVRSTPSRVDMTGFYLTKVYGLDEKWNENAVSMKTLLGENPDELEATAQFNFLIDFGWTVAQYPENCRQKPLTIVTSSQSSRWNDLVNDVKKATNVSLVDARLPIPFGTHHTKMTLLRYRKGLKVAIHTANLIEYDWCEKTQGMYISPLFPLIENNTGTDDYDSKTNFKADLIAYLNAYTNSAVKAWAEDIKNYDMREANVFIVASIPGRHRDLAMYNWGHLKLGRILKTYLNYDAIDANWPVVCQFSSIGSLGTKPEKWLLGEFAASLGRTAFECSALQEPFRNLKLVYPSVENVRCSSEGYYGGTCLPYTEAVASKQQYLQQFMHQWLCECYGRSHAVPHIKTYFRYSPCFQKLAWFLLTSANLSKAAWGVSEKSNQQFNIRSYEIGVLFIPEFFCGLKTFTTHRNVETSSAEFPLPIDLPLVPYSQNDKMWIIDIPYDEADAHGITWDP